MPLPPFFGFFYVRNVCPDRQACMGNRLEAAGKLRRFRRVSFPCTPVVRAAEACTPGLFEGSYLCPSSSAWLAVFPSYVTLTPTSASDGHAVGILSFFFSSQDVPPFECFPFAPFRDGPHVRSLCFDFVGEPAPLSLIACPYGTDPCPYSRLRFPTNSHRFACDLCHPLSPFVGLSCIGTHFRLIVRSLDGIDPPWSPCIDPVQLAPGSSAPLRFPSTCEDPGLFRCSSPLQIGHWLCYVLKALRECHAAAFAQSFFFAPLLLPVSALRPHERRRAHQSGRYSPAPMCRARQISIKAFDYPRGLDSTCASTCHRSVRPLCQSRLRRQFLSDLGFRLFAPPLSVLFDSATSLRFGTICCL